MAIPEDRGVKEKEFKKVEKYQNLARQFEPGTSRFQIQRPKSLGHAASLKEKARLKKLFLDDIKRLPKKIVSRCTRAQELNMWCTISAVIGVI